MLFVWSINWTYFKYFFHKKIILCSIVFIVGFAVTFFAERYTKNRDKFVLVHIVGASQSSTNIRLSLLRLCAEIDDRFGLDTTPTNKEYKSVKAAFWAALTKLSEVIAVGKTVFDGAVFIIDAVNQVTISHSCSLTIFSLLPSLLFSSPALWGLLRPYDGLAACATASGYKHHRLHI